MGRTPTGPLELCVGAALAEAEDTRGQLLPVGLALEQTEGGTLLQCSTWTLEWMTHVLAGLECASVVRCLAELREALERHAAEITALAKRTERGAPS